MFHPIVNDLLGFDPLVLKRMLTEEEEGLKKRKVADAVCESLMAGSASIRGFKDRPDPNKAVDSDAAAAEEAGNWNEDPNETADARAERLKMEKECLAKARRLAKACAHLLR